MGLYFLREEKGGEKIEGEGKRESGESTKGEFGHRLPC